MTLQLKLNTIEKYVGKVYKKETIDGVAKLVLTLKIKDNYLHIKNIDLYELNEKLQEKCSIVKGFIEDFLGRVMEVENIRKFIQLSVILYILCRGHPMIDYPSITGLLHFLKVYNYLNIQWLVNSGQEWAAYLTQVEREDMKAKIKKSHFIALSLDEFMEIDNTSQVCMHIYKVNDLWHQPFLLFVAKLNCSMIVESLYDLLQSTCQHEC